MDFVPDCYDCWYVKPMGTYGTDFETALQTVKQQWSQSYNIADTMRYVIVVDTLTIYDPLPDDRIIFEVQLRDYVLDESGQRQDYFRWVTQEYIDSYGRYYFGTTCLD